MSSEQRIERKRREIEELARGWGKLLAREVFPEGVGLEVDLFTMEEIAVTAAKSLVRGAVETMSGDQALTLGAEHPCPGCGKLCQLDHRLRAIQVRGGRADLDGPAAHCSTCRRDFFPLRPVLKIDAHPYSPTLLHRIVLMAGMADSCEAAATALEVVGEIQIPARTVNKLGAQIGGQMADERDRRTRAYQQRPLPRVATQVDPPPQLAAVFCDGGRMRTRVEGGGHGVHQPHWRETKNAAFHRMQSESHKVDPQPALPECFRNQAYVEKLVIGLKKAKNPQPELISPVPQQQTPPTTVELPAPATWQPKTLLRTCVSSLATSDEFGPQMAAEAEARGFFAAAKRAFVGDGQAYNWTIQQQWFYGFTPIVDFIHVVEYVYEAAKAIEDEAVSRWQQYVSWANACWQGNVDQVIEELQRHGPQSREDAVTAEQGATETEKVVRRSWNYLTNNRSRMDYVRYRRDGLPVTSSLAESLVKQISKRVKGSEKFWDDGASGEAILQVRAAVISQDGRLARFLCDRSISPYSPRCRIPTPATAA